MSKHVTAARRIAEPVGDPHVALTIDAKPAATPTSVKFFRLAGIRSREPCHVPTHGIRYPDPILLIDAQMERAEK